MYGMFLAMDDRRKQYETKKRKRFKITSDSYFACRTSANGMNSGSRSGGDRIPDRGRCVDLL